MTETLQFDFARDQKTPLPVADTYASQIKGRSFIVTGANTGLGFEAAKHFVRLGASRVILAVRSVPKGEEAKTKIEAETAITGVAEVWLLDLSSYSSIIAFAKKVEGLERLDTIVENAAIALDKWSTGDKGMETSMIVNVTGTMLLAGLVMPKLQESAKKFGIKPHLSIAITGVAFQEDARDELNRISEGTHILDWLNAENHGLKAR
jgi:NAD(P)-dependent dehydrogenase (short-subunit alcohol dehydrogenase family)